MTKTQIQMPDDLYAAMKAFAARREWSLAETLRRGAELLMQVYADDVPANRESWSLPRSSKVGWRGLDDDALRDAAFADADPRVDGVAQ